MHGTGELMTLRACLAGLVFALLLAHCGGGPIGPSVPLNEEFVVAPGDSVQESSPFLVETLYGS